MNTYKKIKFYIFGVAIIATIYVLVVIQVRLYDPAQLFSVKYPGYYKRSEGISAKRMIDEHDFNCVILGSSMMTSTSEYEFKDPCINLFFAASTWNGRSAILKYLLEKKPDMKNIITTYDGFYEHSLDKNVIDFVFSPNNHDKVRYYLKSLLGGEYIKCLIKASKEPDCIGEKYIFNLSRHDSYLQKNRQ